MLMFIRNLLYRHILVQHYLSYGSESYHAVLATHPGNEKIHSGTTGQPRKEVPVNYEHTQTHIHTHIHTHATVELNLSHGQYSQEINYHATHTHQQRHAEVGLIRCLIA